MMLAGTTAGLYHLRRLDASASSPQRLASRPATVWRTASHRVRCPRSWDTLHETPGKTRKVPSRDGHLTHYTGRTCTETEETGHICVSVQEFQGKWTFFCTETEKQAYSWGSVQERGKEIADQVGQDGKGRPGRERSARTAICWRICILPCHSLTCSVNE